MCRKKLVPHIGAFSELHSKIGSLGAEEQVKVVQGITSVIQALDPDEAVQPVEGIIGPIVDRLNQAVQQGDMEGLLQSINALAACFKGLAPSEDEMFDTDDTPRNITNARDRLQGLRQRIEGGVVGVIGVWQGDGEVADVGSAYDYDVQYNTDKYRQSRHWSNHQRPTTPSSRSRPSRSSHSSARPLNAPPPHPLYGYR